jgi:hypothetical protein
MSGQKTHKKTCNNEKQKTLQKTWNKACTQHTMILTFVFVQTLHNMNAIFSYLY